MLFNDFCNSPQPGASAADHRSLRVHSDIDDIMRNVVFVKEENIGV
jgi:hypothetical protein